MDPVDVVVIGAGPAGCASALSCAHRGARVVMLESGHGPARRLAGEWIQPAGVQALLSMGVDLAAETAGDPGRGFVVHPSRADEPIVLRYPEGGAVCVAHDRLVEALRHIVVEHPRIELISGARVHSVAPAGTVHTSGGALRGSVVIGADGGSSVVRAFLNRQRPDPPRTAWSHLAGLALEDVALPTEQYGHIMLGGPGPALAYRLDERTVRLCLDVPRPRPRARELSDYLWHGYQAIVPEEMRDPLATQLARGEVRWAANHVRRRTFYGRGRFALVGDAVGQAHPLVASGLSNAFLDAACLARSASVAAYARQRSAQSWTSDRLAAGIYRLFRDDSAATAALRRSVFGLWRADARLLDRSLRLLAMTDGRRSALLTAFLTVLTDAVSARARHAVRTRRWADLPQEILGVLAWLGWLCGPDPQVPAPSIGRGSGPAR